MIDHQDNLAVDLVADLTSIEATYGAPHLATHSAQYEFGVDAATRGVAGVRLKVWPPGLGQCVDIVYCGAVGAQAPFVVEEAVEQHAHLCTPACPAMIAFSCGLGSAMTFEVPSPQYLCS